MTTLFPKPGSIGTPDNPKIESPGRIPEAKVAAKVKVHSSKVSHSSVKAKLNKFLKSRVTNRPVTRESQVVLNLKRMGF